MLDFVCGTLYNERDMRTAAKRCPAFKGKGENSMAVRTETETVVKRILPYLERRGYEIETDLDFETAAKTADRYSSGYIDILVTLGKRSASFLIEAKRISHNLTAKDRDQAISYARSKTINVPFVVVTNGVDIHCYNSKNKMRILWDGKDSDKIPGKGQLKQVMDALGRDPDAHIIGISGDTSLPDFRCAR
jgi:type I restriction enzyme M protein